MRLIAEKLALVRAGRRLFEDLAFTVAAGEALAVTGPNGAGKSSLLRAIAGFLKPAAGRVVLEGEPAGAAMHFVGHLDGVKAALSAAENLDFLCAILGGGRADHGPVLRRLGLERLAGHPAGMLSAGQKRRLALARLLVVPRPLWLLDEPLTALDAEGQRTFAALAEEHLAAGGLVIAATHAPLGIAGARELRLEGRGA